MAGMPTDVLVTSAGTTTIHTFPSCSLAGTSDTVALPVQGVTGGIAVKVSATALPLPTGAAGDGTDGTGLSPPTGGAGIRGWLSGCYDKLANIYAKLLGSIAVTGTFWQVTQPVSGASGSFVDGANATIGATADSIWSGAGSGSLIAIEKAIYGKLAASGSTMVSQTPVVTSNGVYAAGKEIGGKMTFAIIGAGSGTLTSARVTSRSVLTTLLKLYVFTTDPTNSTWTNNSTPAINVADIPSLLCVVQLNSPDSGLGTHTIWNSGNIGMKFVGANLYGILTAVAGDTLTSTSTSDITVTIGASIN